jgi:hypothetical protein
LFFWGRQQAEPVVELQEKSLRPGQSDSETILIFQKDAGVKFKAAQVIFG